MENENTEKVELELPKENKYALSMSPYQLICHTLYSQCLLATLANEKIPQNFNYIIATFGDYECRLAKKERFELLDKADKQIEFERMKKEEEEFRNCIKSKKNK